MRRLVCWSVLVAVAVTGCARPAPDQPAAASDQTDVWFCQHLVPHLRQTTSVVAYAQDRVTRPELARLARTVDRQAAAHLQLLQAWLDQRGLAPHTHSHQPVDSPRRSDLERLAALRGSRFDLAFLEVMAARQRVSARLAAVELSSGSRPEVRQLAERLLAEQRAQARLLVAARAQVKGVEPDADEQPQERRQPGQ